MSSTRPRQHKKTKPFSQEAVNLMIASTPEKESDENKENEEEDDDDEEEELYFD